MNSTSRASQTSSTGLNRLLETKSAKRNSQRLRHTRDSEETNQLPQPKTRKIAHKPSKESHLIQQFDCRQKKNYTEDIYSDKGNEISDYKPDYRSDNKDLSPLQTQSTVRLAPENIESQLSFTSQPLSILNSSFENDHQRPVLSGSGVDNISDKFESASNLYPQSQISANRILLSTAQPGA